ncbi:Protein PAT1-like protein, partial [Cucurbita argyrosperma subsp. sororia]
MDVFGNGARVQVASTSGDLKRFGANSTEDALFDASQYAFFGKDVMEEVELGGLEDEEDDTLAAGIEEKEEEFLFDKEWFLLYCALEGSKFPSSDRFDNVSLAEVFNNFWINVLRNVSRTRSRCCNPLSERRLRSLINLLVEMAFVPPWFGILCMWLAPAECVSDLCWREEVEMVLGCGLDSCLG